jgi:hypothetical protein
MTTEEIQKLFYMTCNLLNTPESGRRDWWIFKQALGDTPESYKALSIFLKDVTTCPTEVIVWCQTFLAPKAPSRKAAE